MPNILSKILLVDDDPDYRDSLAEFLREKQGMFVSIAANGEDALVHARAFDTKYDVAIVDLDLPGISGTETVRRLKELMPDLLIIMVTGFGPGEAVNALKAGAYRYLLKPLDLTELVILIHDALRQKSLRRLASLGDSLAKEVAAGVHAVAQKAAQLACEITAADYAAVYPYDVVRRQFYDTKSVGTWGFPDTIVVTDKPREAGMASLVRQVGELVVRDVGTGTFGSTALGDDVDISSLAERVKGSHFVNRFGVNAFVGLSLRAGSLDDSSDEAGVMYLDYTEPREFTDEDLNIFRILGQQIAGALRNSQLLAQERTQRQMAEGLSRISYLINEESRFEDIVVVILRELKLLVPFESAAIYLTDQGSGRFISAHRYPEKYDRELPEPPEWDELWRRLRVTGEPVIVSEPEEFAHWEYSQLLKPFGSWVGVPLIVDGRSVGLLTMDADQRGQFRDLDKATVQSLANLTAIAIEKTRLQRNVTYLYRLATIITHQEPDEPEEYARHVVAIISDFLRADFCDLYLLEEQQGRRTLVSKAAQFGWRSGVSDPLDGPDLDDSFEGSVLLGREPRIVANIHDGDQHWRLSPRDWDMRSFIGVPVGIEDEVSGVLSAAAHQPGAFSKDDLAFLNAASAMIAMGISAIRQRSRRIHAVQRQFNPYRAGPPVEDPSKFYGRGKLIQEILDGIHNNYYIVCGPRRIGKTSLLFNIANALTSISARDQTYAYLPVYFSLEGIGAKELLRFVMQQIVQRAVVPEDKLHLFRMSSNKYAYGEFEHELKEVISNLKERYPLEGDSSRQIRIVLLMDEMDKFLSYDSSTHERFRSAVLNSPTGAAHVKVIMSGVAIHQLHDSLTSPLFNQFQVRRLGPLTEAEARQLIMEPVKGYYIYDPKAVDAICHTTKLKPQDIQRLASRAVSVMLERVRSEAGELPNKSLGKKDIIITEEDVNAAAKLVTEEEE
jgi:GAF domain-containing protein/ActR/RegA family two-component response regulator